MTQKAAKRKIDREEDLMVSGMMGGGLVGNGADGASIGQEYCLKWNNHRSTILSVMDSLLEEESLVDVTLSADGQFIRAHRVILSACSPYFRNLFKSSFLLDKHPVIVMKDVDFDNLKSLVEYMYKGEANVPQHMLTSFIQTAESLQIRGLAEGASKQKLEQVAELNNLMPHHLTIPSIPITPNLATSPFKAEASLASGVTNSKKGSLVAPQALTFNPTDMTGGILAARLAKMAENPPLHMFDIREQLALAARHHSALVPPPMKKPRKAPVTSSPLKTTTDTPGKQEISVKKDLLAKSSRMSPKSTNIMAPSTATTTNSSNSNNNNNNYESDSDVLKIDEDIGEMDSKDDDGKGSSDSSNIAATEDDIAEIEVGMAENGLEDSEEEAAMTQKELVERAGEMFRKQAQGSGVGFINPWTGEEIPGISAEDQDDDSMQGDGIGPVFPSLDSSLTSLSRSMELVAANPAAGLINNNSLGSSGNGGGGEDRGSSATSGSDAARDPMTNKYACTRCGRSYLHQATLVRHQRYECGISASYPCQLCGRKFKRRDVLKGHMEKCMNKSTNISGGAVTGANTTPAAVVGITAPVTTGSPSPLVSVASPVVPFQGAL